MTLYMCHVCTIHCQAVYQKKMQSTGNRLKSISKLKTHLFFLIAY